MPEPGDLYVAPAPQCPVHGQMKVCTCGGDHHGTTLWVCMGYDGEGCDRIVRAEDLDWTYIGHTTGPIEFTFTGPLHPNALIAFGGDFGG